MSLLVSRLCPVPRAFPGVPRAFPGWGSQQVSQPGPGPPDSTPHANRVAVAVAAVACVALLSLPLFPLRHMLTLVVGSALACAVSAAVQFLRKVLTCQPCSPQAHFGRLRRGFGVAVRRCNGFRLPLASFRTVQQAFRCLQAGCAVRRVRMMSGMRQRGAANSRPASAQPGTTGAYVHRYA